jgi:hypothetical protein
LGNGDHRNHRGGDAGEAEQVAKPKFLGEIGPWDYVIDDITTPLQNVIGVEVDRFVNGQTIIQELHWQLLDKQWTWFSDCGDPLPG